jgi:hypothetical protein
MVRMTNETARPLADCEAAQSADCCGALGCREDESLVLVEDGADQRVLCPRHARSWA